MRAYMAEHCVAVIINFPSTASRIHYWFDLSTQLILEDTISIVPSGPIVRQDDPRWRDIVLWSFNVQIAAEELGITSANIDALRTQSRNAEIQRMLGVHDNFGEKLGLPHDWAYNIIRTVGNYAESWNRHLAPLGLSRGVNANWINGGLLSALPFR